MGPKNPSLGDTLAAVGTATLVGALIWAVLGIPLLIIVVVVNLGAGPAALGAFFVWLTVRIVNRGKRWAAGAVRLNPMFCFVLTLTVTSAAESRDIFAPKDACLSYESYLKTFRSVAFSSRFVDRNADQSDTFTNGLAQTWRIDFQRKRIWSCVTSASRAAEVKLDATWTPVYTERLISAESYFDVSADPDSLIATKVASRLSVPKDYWAAQMGLLYLSLPLGFIQEGAEYLYIPNLLLRDLSAKPNRVVPPIRLRLPEAMILKSPKLPRNNGWYWASTSR